MPTPIIAGNPDAVAPFSFRRREFRTLLPLAGLLFAWCGLWSRLSIDWTINDQYQYGWFIPPLALVLVRLRWSDRPSPLRDGEFAGRWRFSLAVGACLLLLLLLPISVLEVPNPDWRLLYWIHAALLTALTFEFVAWSGGPPWVRHFAFPVGFLLLAIPWPSGLEQAIIQPLVRALASLAAGALSLIGIPVHVEGNLLRVRDQFILVDETCSGIRSLQLVLAAGYLLGEGSRLSVVRRLLLLSGGLLVAFLVNVARSTLLVWLGGVYGVATLEKYHGLAGMLLLFFVVLGALGLNRLLVRNQQREFGSGSSAPVDSPAAVGSSRPPVPPMRSLPRFFVLASCGWLLCIQIDVAAWYDSRPAKGLARAERWSVNPPVAAPGFRSIRVDDRSARLLHYDSSIASCWDVPRHLLPAAKTDACSLFFFRWEPGHASAAEEVRHQPHICLTESDFAMTADYGVQPITLPDGLALPVHGYDFRWRGQPIYVFFVAWEDDTGGQSLRAGSTGRWDRVRAALDRRKSAGGQTLELLFAGPSSQADATALCRRELTGIVHRL